MVARLVECGLYLVHRAPRRLGLTGAAGPDGPRRPKRRRRAGASTRPRFVEAARPERLVGVDSETARCSRDRRPRPRCAPRTSRAPPPRGSRRARRSCRSRAAPPPGAPRRAAGRCLDAGTAGSASPPGRPHPAFYSARRPQHRRTRRNPPHPRRTVERWFDSRLRRGRVRGQTFKRCGCPTVRDADGNAIACPRLRSRGHGSWYYPTRPSRGRDRPAPADVDRRVSH